MKKLLGGLLKAILEGLVSSSYIICLTVAMISIILYICGCKKAGKYVSISIVAYILLQAVKGALN
ncbi:hypothetical protein [Clostridium sp.]|uniref:hypothetical protein n=1 Tax=Clostridium sp. TaxID=1506 RepID=UPI001DC0DB0F|nr:hypothetical protein [Clostridium sp.]MBS5937733.1 hypothetical protein [Clostridium sp.]